MEPIAHKPSINREIFTISRDHVPVNRVSSTFKDPIDNNDHVKSRRDGCLDNIFKGFSKFFFFRDKTSLAAFVGIIFIFSAILSFFFLPEFILSIIHKKIILKNGSEIYPNWKRLPVPLFNRFYFFNVLNPKEIENGAKPRLAEMGPFTYRLFLQKYDIHHFDNGTVSYREKRVWKFMRNMSIADDTTLITTLNTPLTMSLSWLSRGGPLISGALRVLLEATTASFFIKMPVKQLLFEGYSDHLTILAMAARPEVETFYRGRFGYFYPKNNTDDGLYRVSTGENDIRRLNRIESYNNLSHLKFWTSNECNNLRKSTKSETRAPPGNETTELHMFNAEICRVLRLVYQKSHREKSDLLVRRFVLDPNTFKNFKDYPPNACYHVKRKRNSPVTVSFRSSIFERDPLPSGVIDIGPCKFNAPVFLSHPHFLNADPIYRDSVTGMKPDPVNHTFWLDVEPTTGGSVQVAARIQLNIGIDSQSFIRYRYLPQIIFPILWFEYRTQMTDELLDRLKLVQWLPKAIPMYISYLFLSLGCTMCIVCTFIRRNRILSTMKRAAVKLHLVRKK
ncbi:scavenger receptor class B member 1-like [Brevipalpus obovatus]|uniref:scavenger receptor class B member 1-like n=1 Tax=Brevipalpus obovatus TaxID=246614 RepID=UPI003D9FA6BF